MVGLEVGEFYSKVVEDRSSFMVVRSVSRNGEDVLLETIKIPKMAFDPWFKTQSQLVNIIVLDNALEESLLTEVDVPYITDRMSDHR